MESKKFFEMRRVEIRKVGKQEEEAGMLWEKIERRERDLQDMERWGRIRESKYNV